MYRHSTLLIDRSNPGCLGLVFPKYRATGLFPGQSGDNATLVRPRTPISVIRSCTDRSLDGVESLCCGSRSIHEIHRKGVHKLSDLCYFA